MRRVEQFPGVFKEPRLEHELKPNDTKYSLVNIDYQNRLNNATITISYNQIYLTFISEVDSTSKSIHKARQHGQKYLILIAGMLFFPFTFT